MKRVLALLVVLGACAPAEAPPPDSPDTAAADAADAAAIQAASRAFSDAYVAGDTATIGALYTEDAVLLPASRRVEGREAIKAFFAPGPNRVNLTHAMTSGDLIIDGDLAVDVGEWSNTWRMGDGDPLEAAAPYLVVWERGEDGRWRIRYDMWHRPPG